MEPTAVAGLGNLFQKAVYLGVGMAAYAGDQATKSLSELKDQAQKLADELVERGEMTTEEARKMVDDLVNRSQVTTVEGHPVDEAPRKIEIDLDDDTSPASAPMTQAPQANKKPPEQQQADALRQQVEDLQAQLERLKKS